MCLAVITARHPAYSFILLSNRDEFLNRPTAHADWWPSPHSHVLGGRDLQRPEQGTWLGITKQGRLSLLTNFREEGEKLEQRSRGEIAKSYLVIPPDSPETPKQFAKRLVEGDGVQGVGGFSLIFGELRKDPQTGQRSPLGIISNRTPDADSVTWVAGVDSPTQAWTCALSNSLYGDKDWPKVNLARSLLDDAITKGVEGKETEDQLMNRFFELLSNDQLPKRQPDEPWNVFTRKLRLSIFVPPTDATEKQLNERVDGNSTQTEAIRVYGTQKQTVILVDHAGRTTLVERTLFDDQARPVDDPRRDRTFSFDIQGWTVGEG